MIEEITDSDDTKGSSQRGSLKSTTSSAAIQARAKAQSLKAKVEYTKKEADLRQKETELASALLILGAEKDYAMAEAEAEVLEAAASEEGRSVTRPNLSLPKSNPMLRTTAYVEEHFSEGPRPKKEENLDDLAHGTSPNIEAHIPESKAGVHSEFGGPVYGPDVHAKEVFPGSGETTQNNEPKPDPNQGSTENVEGPVGKPSVKGEDPRNDRNMVQLNSISNMLLKKELVKSGLRKFSGNPGEYRSWKGSFKQATGDFDLSPIQEMDLIMDNIEGNAKALVQRIYDIHVDRPELGLKRIWAHLDEKYGSAEAIEHDLMRRLEEFPKIAPRDNVKLEEYGYLLMEAEYIKESKKFPGLLVLDSSRGLQPLVQRLPDRLKLKWRDMGYKYKEKHSVLFPPFKVFVEFVQDQARIQNDPSFTLADAKATNIRVPQKPAVTVRKTGVKDGAKALNCPIHNAAHELQECRGFQEKTLEERTSFVKSNRLCFKCLQTGHMARNCKSEVKCETCGKGHVTIMHRTPPNQETPPTSITLNCTKVCGENEQGRSCAKICLAKVYLTGKPEKAALAYVLIDDQSDGSLINGNLLDSLDVTGKKSRYAVKTVNGLKEIEGRKLSGLTIESLDGTVQGLAPTLFECNNIPGNRSEIPTPEAAASFSHLKQIAASLPKLNDDAEIAILLGRDAPQFHKIREVINGDDDQPWAHRLDLGWVVMGEVCLNGAHVRGNHNQRTKDTVTTNFTQVLKNGRTSVNFQPCSNVVEVKRGQLEQGEVGENVFVSTYLDERLGPSLDDLEFMEIMSKELVKDPAGNWCSPLPFRSNRRKLPNNRPQAETRMNTLSKALARDELKKEHYFEFMGKILDKNLAERVADECTDTSMEMKEVWYLPHFGVYHPRKPDKLRVVFDSSAAFSGVSLNDVLLSGPDLMNQLLGVLIRFREEPVAITADIEQMFYAFKVREDHRRYLRFLWYEGNRTDGAIVTYQMSVHIFGNKPSPAVAISGLRKTGEEGEMAFGKDVRKIVETNFYMDDLLKSLPTVEEAVDVLKRTRDLLMTANIRLHKFASNNPDVLAAFEPGELAPNLAEADLTSKHEVSVQRTLGVCWDLKTDSFTFRLAEPNPNCCTKRMVLSEVNGVFDPIGLAAPVIIKGKMLLREMTKGGVDWDDPLPEELLHEWKTWRDSLTALKNVYIPRPFAPFSSSQTIRRELHTFGDASNKAIGAVCYLRTVGVDGEVHVHLVMGKAKLSPKAATTIPRLELCAAVVASEIERYVSHELQIPIDESKLYTDSKVVLGYITNTKRRFRTYVCNRVNQILQTTDPKQWLYISTSQNPSDQASRSILASELNNSMWLTGPQFLMQRHLQTGNAQGEAEVDILENDPEVCSEKFICHKVTLQQRTLGVERFSKFSSWKSLVRAITNLIHVASSFKAESKCKGWHYCEKTKSVEEVLKAEAVIIRNLQSEAFASEITELRTGKLTKGNKLMTLNPYVDCEGILRVGGRLQHAQLSKRAMHPAILPKGHHVTGLIINHYHLQCNHQGRHITLGTLRNEGYWVIGGQRQISKLLQDCVTCIRLRGKFQEQIMASLPEERVSEAPPFTFVGVDVFGPFAINSRRTRASTSQPKRWAALFTCMVTRGVHIEVLESMDSSCFINALRRFFAVRGPARQIRSDCGSNFVGACNEIGRHLGDKEPIKRYLLSHHCEWVFNPPHASNMGGAWERMIGIARRILDAILRDVKASQLTHEVFTTLMAEVAAIINSRPLLPDCNVPELPLNLSPNMLLTMKSSQVTAPDGVFNHKDLLRSQWRRVQHLSNMFWEKWRKEYLPLLQSREKWKRPKRNLRVGDIVLVKQEVHRNFWPLGKVLEVITGEDGHVRKANLEVATDDPAKIARQPINRITKKTMLRPIRELVLLLPVSD
ncbi:hypothetical protein HOLleu_24812 [Holothuria leucospilota]|uniref:Uncharacterized protein n=1 Tax=Holothuria leucospilota TaxID=206669 RepID=A0A9Q1BS48_HOLLE|nr:hypothetical protein HOLleu_24812 [Holothuria leucospilota]